MLPQREGHVVVDRHAGKQGAALEQHAHPFAHFIEARTGEGGDIFPVKQNVTGLRLELATDQPQQGGFTDAARAHDGGHLATRNGQVDPVIQQPISVTESQIGDGDQVIVQTIVHPV